MPQEIINLIAHLTSAESTEKLKSGKRRTGVLDFLTGLLSEAEGERTVKQRGVRRKQRKRGPIAAGLKFLFGKNPYVNAVIGGLEAHLNRKDLKELSDIFGDKFANTAIESWAKTFEEETLEQAGQYDPGKSALMGFIEGQIGKSQKVKSTSEFDILDAEGGVAKSVKVGDWITGGQQPYKDWLGGKFDFTKTFEPLAKGLEEAKGTEDITAILSSLIDPKKSQGLTKTLTDWKPLIEQSAIGALPLAMERPKTTGEIYRYFSQMSPNV
jgi:hypothetical protein